MSENPSRAPALLLLLAAAVACASGAKSPAPPPAAPPAAEETKAPAQFEPWAPAPGADGSSMEKAVLVDADNEEDGVLWERRWIFDHFGRFRRKSVGLAAAHGRHFDVIVVELADHSEKTFYFDCTNFLGREKKSPR